MNIQRIAQAAMLAVAASLTAPVAFAQNIAIVNGKAVPVSRFETMKAQVAKQGQPITPDIEAKIKEQLVMREIFAQEAEKRGVAASKEYRDQMEFARQSVLIQTTRSSRLPTATRNTVLATSWSRRKKTPRP